jgi:hypothetical protein
MSKNLVLVVDDDAAILKGVQRLLRQHAYEAVVFSSAEAFKSHTDFDRAACVILDRLGHRAEGSAQGWWGFRAGYLHQREWRPCCSQSCAGFRMHCVSYKAFNAQSLIQPIKKASAEH